MSKHQAIWYDHDGYITNQQYGNNVVYETVTLDGNILDDMAILVPTGETNQPEGWPIYNIKDCVPTIAINPNAK